MASDSNSSSGDGGISSPEASRESKGSSVSTGLREEYEDLLRYAVVTPNFDGRVKGVLKKPPNEGTSSPATGPGVHSVQVSQLELPEEQEEDSGEGTNEEHDDDISAPPPPPPPPPSHPTLNPCSNPKVSFKSTTNHYSDPELVRLDNQLDIWCTDLKRNVLAEFEQAQIRSREQQRLSLAQEMANLASQRNQLESQLERTSTLLATYEESIGKKDQIIQRLTKSLQKQKDRIGLARSFSNWRAHHNDEKREIFTSTLARKHYNYQLKRKAMRSWFGLIQGRWRERIQKACQLRAEEVCQQLKSSHNEDIKALQQSLEEREVELRHLHKERNSFEENMKKAFMRGVCALNMEAMSVFHPGETGEGGCYDNQHPPQPPHDHHYKGGGGGGGKRREPKVTIERHLH